MEELLNREDNEEIFDIDISITIRITEDDELN